MSNFWTSYAENPDLVENGVWVDDFNDGVRVKLRKPSSLKAREVRAQLEEREPYRLALRKAARTRGRISAELEDRLNKEWFARGIVVDWEGVPAFDGSGLLPFTPENAILVFNKLTIFYEDCVTAATSQDLYKDDLKEENVGN